MSSRRTRLTSKQKQISLTLAAKHLLYNDLPLREAQACWKMTEPSSYEAFIAPVDFGAADVTIPKTYIVCGRDVLMSPNTQAREAAAAGFSLVRINGGHSAHAGVPYEVAKVLAETAGVILDPTDDQDDEECDRLPIPEEMQEMAVVAL
jgi:hypothetical protein